MFVGWLAISETDVKDLPYWNTFEQDTSVRDMTDPKITAAVRHLGLLFQLNKLGRTARIRDSFAVCMI